MRDNEKIKILQDSIKSLEQENLELKNRLAEKDKEIEELKKDIEEESARVDEETKKMESVIQAHKRAIEEANELALNYTAAMRDARKVREKYEKEMREQLSRIRKIK